MKKDKVYEIIRGAVARGWTYKKNSGKILDPDLANAIVEEVVSLLTVSQITEKVEDVILTRVDDDLKSFEEHIVHKMAHELGNLLISKIDVEEGRDVFLQAKEYKMKIYYLADKPLEE